LGCQGLVSASKKEPHGRFLSPPPSQWEGEENRKEKAKLVGWDKNSLTEWQREKKITTTIPIKIIHRGQFSHHLMLSLFPSSKSPFSSQLPH